jgi:hypothetical protein
MVGLPVFLEFAAESLVQQGFFQVVEGSEFLLVKGGVGVNVFGTGIGFVHGLGNLKSTGINLRLNKQAVVFV